MRALRLRLWGLLIAVLMACGGGDDSATEAHGTASVLGSTCDEGDLIDPTICAGPWQYQRYTPGTCYANIQAFDCPIDLNQTCNAWGSHNVTVPPLVHNSLSAYGNIAHSAYGQPTTYTWTYSVVERSPPAAGYPSARFNECKTVYTLSPAIELGQSYVGGDGGCEGDYGSTSRPTVQKKETERFKQIYPSHFNTGTTYSAKVETFNCRSYCDESYPTWNSSKQKCCTTTGGGYGQPPAVTTCVAKHTQMSSSDLKVCNYGSSTPQPSLVVYSASDVPVNGLSCRDATANYATRGCDCDTNVQKRQFCVTSAHPVVRCPLVGGSSPVAYWTPAIGKDLAYVRSLPNSAADTISPVCLSGDVSLNLQPPERYARLYNALEGIPSHTLDDPQGARAALVSKLKLLLELHGDKLDEGQRAFIRTLYVSDPTSARGCGDATVWAPPADTATCGNVSTINAHMTRCSRLLMSHVSPETAAVEVDACIADLDADLRALPTQCTAYNSQFEHLSTELLRKALERMLLDDADAAKQAARRAELNRRLVLVQSWWDGVKRVIRDPEALARDMDTVTASLLQGAYSWKLQNLDTATSLAQVEQTLRSNPDVAQELALVAFPPGTAKAPLAGAPLVYVVADLLREPSERLDQTDYLHDLGCRFQNCVRRDASGKPNGWLSTPLTQMHDLIAALPAQADLSAAHTAATGVSSAWRDVFHLIEQRHPVLQSAIADAAAAATYSPDLLTGSAVPEIALSDLRAIVQRSSKKLAWYKVSGRLREGDQDVVDRPLLQYKLDEALAIEESLWARLHDANESYKSNALALIDTQLQRLSSGQADADAKAELQIKTTTAQSITNDLEMLRTAMNVDSAMLGRFSDDYEQAVERLRGSGDRWVSLSTTQLNVVPPDVITRGYPGGVITDVSAFAVPGSHLSVKAGDLVNVSASGQYSPTCALRRAHAAETDPIDPAVEATGSPYGALHTWYRASPELWPKKRALTGPMGFAIGYTDSKWDAHSTSSTPMNSGQAVGMGMQAVGGAMSNAPNPWVAGAGIALSAAGGIVSALTGSDSASHGTEHRATMSYNVGLRLKNTPFRTAPAGALLIVRTSPGDHSWQGILDVQVAQSPSTTVTVDADSDLYLVVNDQECVLEPDEGDRGYLDVSVRRIQALGGFAQTVQPRLAAALASVNEQAETKFQNQGTLLPSDLSTLRSVAMAKLLTSCPDCSDPSFAPIMQFFTSVLDTRLTQVEREVEIRRLERQLEQVVIAYGALATKVMMINSQSQALELREVWKARSIDADLLRDETIALARAIDRDLYPFMHAKYPETINGWARFDPITGTSPYVSLTSYDWSASWSQLADRALVAATDVHDRLKYAKLDFYSQFLDSDPFSPVVTIAIPKPTEWLNDPLDGVLYSPTYRELPGAREVWAAIRANRPARIVLTPELLYMPTDPIGNQYPDQLSCVDTMPVITAVGLQVLNSSATDNSNWQGRSVTMYADPQQTYVGAYGPVKLLNTNKSWLSFTVPLQYTASLVDAMKPGGGEGISPTSTLVLEPKAVWLDPEMSGTPGRRAASALLLRLKMERRRMGVKPRWFPTTGSPICQ